MLRNCKRTRSSIDEGNGDSSTYVPSSSSTILDLFYSVLARKSIASYILELSTPELDICSRVEHTLTMWKDIVPINPEEFLKHLLRSRGYDYHPLPRSQSSKPTSKQIEDYTVELVAAVRDNDLDKLKALHASGIW